MVCDRLSCTEVLQAGELRTARRLVRDEKLDLVFLDVRLPDGSGLAYARELKAEHPQLTVVICTNHNLPEYRDAAREFGASHFVPKDHIFADDAWDEIGRSLT
jgi:DNA-binding NarL/FixJ family response regulator